MPDVFVAFDPEGYYVVNPALSYVPPWSEKIRISLIGAIYDGRDIQVFRRVFRKGFDVFKVTVPVLTNAIIFSKDGTQ